MRKYSGKYKLVYTKNAVKDIRSLDVVVKKKLKSRLEALKKNPLRKSKKLLNSSLGQYRWRVGKLRIIFDINKNNIIILRIGYRREVYK
jgi:mRNA interferase RelE/StbE